MTKDISIAYIKSLGKNKLPENLTLLIQLYNDSNISLDIKREIVSSIGRQSDKKKVFNFIKQHVFLPVNSMDMIYQFYRTILYNLNFDNFSSLAIDIESFYGNEMIYKMKQFYKNKGNKFIQTKSLINTPTIIKGDAKDGLKRLQNNEVKLIFTSPPYYNAKEYSVYRSYEHYLETMKEIFIQCFNVLEDGRFIIINVSPVITKRPGREFESIRYPIHYDFHNLLTAAGFYFTDEVIWIKPDSSVPNRNGGYMQTRMPLSYKPNAVSESIMIYRKGCSFLLDENIKYYKDKGFFPNMDEEFDRTNCWYISPRSSKVHPAIFPEELCERVLKYYSFPGDVVLDPFAGSGTLGDVAIRMNRIPILCEKHSKYIEILKRKGYAQF